MLSIAPDLVLQSKTMETVDGHLNHAYTPTEILSPQIEVRVKNLSITKTTTAGKKQVICKPILHSFSGVFQPGTMTLVLGHPGSGKSSLLKILSGRFPLSKTVTMDGEITYDGVQQSHIGGRLPQFVSYVPQDDRHFPRLSVRETFAFAHECAGSDDDASHATADGAVVATPSPGVVIDQLSLDRCQNTIVGDRMLRGVSGGERKRVTMGEMQFGERVVMLMDEISTGLDSAATYKIVKTQRSLAQSLRKTVVMALLQPAPEVFALFDNVLILNDGYVLYHGPRSQVLAYFEAMGFVRPATRDVADFLMDFGTPQQARYEVAMMEDGAQRPRTPAEFADRFQRSQVYEHMMHAVHSEMDPRREQQMARHLEAVPDFHLDFWRGAWAVTKRDFKVTWRNTSYILGRLIVLLIVALIYATLIYDFDPKDVQLVLGTIFPCILFFALGQTAQLPLFMDARAIFYKQRGANMYRTSSYVLSTIVNQFPVALVEVLIMGVITYWVCGFVADAGAFMIFMATLLATYLAFVGWFFLLSSIAPNIQVAQPLASMSMLIYIVFSGFVITHQDIPDYVVWLYWFNPIAWGVRGLAINEYGHSSFDVCVYDGVDYCAQFGGQKMGAFNLGVFDIYTSKYWIWLGIAYMFFSFFVFMAVGGYALENLRFETPVDTHTGVTATTDSDLSDTQGESPYTVVETPRAVAVGVPSHPRQFTPVTLAFKNLTYAVPNPADPKQPLQLLKGISGFATPGTITALMGSSGAGKTTLMDVIAGRKTGGSIQGEILLNGHPASDLAIRRATGYCEQMDVHAEATTFREALLFSAVLRQGNAVTHAQILESVGECLDLLDMRPIADKLVRGSSIEQMKRLTIGVELAAQPSVLFLDEPTSGLDARSAKMVMDGIRKVADSGRTVVCTIHQPSADVFSVFDSLLLLKRGGEMVYFGEVGVESKDLVHYFESINGVKPLEKSRNPATWILEVVDEGQATDFPSVFNNSELKSSMDKRLTAVGIGYPAQGTEALKFANKRAATEWTQFTVLLKRFADMYKRTPDYNVARLIVNIVLAILLGITFIDADFETYQGVNAGIGMIFTAAVFIGGVSFDSVRPLSIASRNIFYRERASQTYNTLWYVVGATLIEIPYVFATTLVFTSIFFPLVGFTGGLRFVLYWCHLSTFVLIMTYFGQLLVFVLPTLEVSATVSILLTAIFFLFGGFNPPAGGIPTTHKWIHILTPATYPLAILASLVYGECESPSDIGCQPLKGLPPTLPPGLSVKQYVETVFDFDSDEMWSKNFVAMLAFIVALRFLALLALQYIKHQKQ